MNEADFNHNNVYSNFNGLLNGTNTANDYNSLNGHDYDINSMMIKVNGKDQWAEQFKAKLDTYGAEINNPQQMGANFNSSVQQNVQARQSRPDSGLSINNGFGGRSSINHLIPHQPTILWTSKNRSALSFLFNLFRNVDWKTVSIAIIWPFIIRLDFYLMKKVKLVV